MGQEEGLPWSDQSEAASPTESLSEGEEGPSPRTVRRRRRRWQLEQTAEAGSQRGPMVPEGEGAEEVVLAAPAGVEERVAAEGDERTTSGEVESAFSPTPSFLVSDAPGEAPFSPPSSWSSDHIGHLMRGLLNLLLEEEVAGRSPGVEKELRRPPLTSGP